MTEPRCVEEIHAEHDRRPDELAAIRGMVRNVNRLLRRGDSVQAMRDSLAISRAVGVLPQRPRDGDDVQPADSEQPASRQPA